MDRTGNRCYSFILPPSFPESSSTEMQKEEQPEAVSSLRYFQNGNYPMALLSIKA
jgi:hypothetical protein